MDAFNEFAINENLALDGRWVDYDTKTSFKIAQSNNMNYAKAFAAAYRKNATAMKSKDKAAEELARKMFATVGAKHLLKDWRGPVSIAGEDLGAYSEEGAEKLLMIQGFARWVDEQAADPTAYKAVQDEEDAKNS
jgi:metal-dependent amidase/aminoacylase/carboxypeptidase family protein